MDVAVVDYGVGNFCSLLRGLQQAGVDAQVSANPQVLAGADRLVLPGVGSFQHAAERLSQEGLRGVLAHKVLERRTPLLGICLGLELLTRSSEEGGPEGLGWIPGATRRLPRGAAALPVPHLGWSPLRRQRSCPLLEGLTGEASFYFAHSYAVECDEPGDVAGTSEYGSPFASLVRRGNIFGTQFHPEKSHANGITVLRNFLSRS